MGQNWDKKLSGIKKGLRKIHKSLIIFGTRAGIEFSCKQLIIKLLKNNVAVNVTNGVTILIFASYFDKTTATLA